MLWKGGYKVKPTFLKYDKPLLTAMIQCLTAHECIVKIKASLEEGAEALGIQLCRLKKEYRTREALTEIFSACKGRPIYVTSYRSGENEGFTDEECVELLLLALDCGATLCDVIGDIFQRSAKYELSDDEEAVKKQKNLIDEIHRRGGEVLISSHTMQPLTVEENLAIAKAHIERGADIIKIVNKIDNKNDIPVCIESIQKITEITDKKLLFLVSGEGQIIRYIGANFGVCMYLCVQSHSELDTPEQPVLRRIKAVRDNMFFG